MAKYKLIDVVVSEIVKHKALGAKTFVFSKPDGSALPYFKAGQYISVKVQIGDSYVSRPYSLCSSPEEAQEGKYAITVQANPGGFAADWMLDNLKKGSKVVITSPQGTFFHRRFFDCNNIVALAGGSGVTPFLSMARAIRDRIENFNLTIIFGNEENDILFKEELDSICNETGKVRVIYVHGFIDASIVKQYAPDSYKILVCGPGEMYRFLTQDLQKLRLPKRRIRTEMLPIEKNPECVKEKVHNITIIDGKSQYKISALSKEPILVAIERAGIKTRSCCRSGICAWCSSKVISGTYYSPLGNECNSTIHPCACFATSDMIIKIPGEEK